MLKYILAILYCCTICDLCHAQKIDSPVISVLKNEKPFLHGKGDALRLTLELQTLYVQEEVFWIGLILRNRSQLSYPVEFIRLYLRDDNQAKRSSLQELEILPLYIDSLKLVKAKDNSRFLIAIPKFTIPDKKTFVIEIFETNGGRNLTLCINNWQLFKAKAIPLKSNHSVKTKQ